MRRIFTHSFSILCALLLTATGYSQDCATSQPNPNVCGDVKQDFNSGDGGFTAVGLQYVVANGRFERDVPGAAGTARTSSLTSVAYTKTANQANVIQSGFKLTLAKMTVNTVKLDVLNAETDALVASCTRTFNTSSSQTICMGIFSTNITEGLAVKLRFTITSTNSGSGNGGHLINLDDFSTGETGENAALPVTFVSFDAKKANGGTLLTWNVADEINVARYEVEKNSGNGFIKIGEVAASQKPSYSFTDAQVAQGTVQYRVRNVDIDGAFKYTSIINFKNGASSIVLRAFPMPASNSLTVQHTAVGNGRISIVNASGQIVKSLIPQKGSVQTDLKLDGLKAGVYMLRFDAGNGKLETLKIVKQ